MSMAAIFLLSAAGITATAGAKDAPTVGGAAMYPERTITENASQASNLTTLVSAVKAAGLGETLSGKGPFTVFAPSNTAFEKLPAGTVDTLLKPESKNQLTGVLTYHIVPGTITAEDLIAKVKANGGAYEMTTVAGGTISAKLDSDKVVITDANGGTATVETADVLQSNGVVHVIDAVLLPKT
jgi:uncharacterized surface protein with fasciclin (FAS1) repeats